MLNLYGKITYFKNYKNMVRLSVSGHFCFYVTTIVDNQFYLVNKNPYLIQETMTNQTKPICIRVRLAAFNFGGPYYPKVLG